MNNDRLFTRFPGDVANYSGSPINHIAVNAGATLTSLARLPETLSPLPQ